MKNKALSVLFALLLSITALAQNFTGSWTGIISAGESSLHIVFNISQDAEGNTVCTMDSPDQSVKGIPAQIVFESSDSISIRISNLGIEYNGKFNGDMICGVYSQLGLELDLDLKNEQIVY